MDSIGDLLAKVRRQFQEHPAPVTSLPERNSAPTSPVCKVCNGQGAIVHNVPYDHPNFGRTWPCPACYKPDTLKLCGVPANHRGDFFNTLDLSQAPRIEAALKAIQSIALGAADYHMMLLCGETGSGKTHLLYAATLAACGRGLFARYITVAQLLSELKSRMNWGDDVPPGFIPYEPYWYKAQRWPFLCLDGIEDTQLTPWAWGMLDELVDTRYAEGLPVVAATNLRPGSIPPRMLSRFRDNRSSRLILLDAPDYRLRRSGE